MIRMLFSVVLVVLFVLLEEYIKQAAAACVVPCVIITTKFFTVSVLASLNSGFSFGLGGALPHFFHVGLPLILIAAVFCEGIVRLRTDRAAYAELLIVSGGCANLYDRIVHGAVRDYLATTLWGYEMPIINMGDVLIVLGVALFLLRELCVYRSMRCSKR